jgi:hypothetical protein
MVIASAERAYNIRRTLTRTMKASPAGREQHEYRFARGDMVNDTYKAAAELDESRSERIPRSLARG